jgi:hypothetical protein
VVIDDGSPEPPSDVVRDHPEVTLLAAEDNGGPYRLVQAVIDATAFDAYLFQDADDWSAPDRLAVLLDEAQRTGAELVGSHEVRVLVEQGDVVSVRYPHDVNQALRERPTAFPLLHPTSIIARTLLERLGGFATGMRFSGDAELLRRAGHVARVVNADHFGYFRRKRPGSLTLGSDTALGSPARLAVQEQLAARATANAERARAGRAPDLEPMRRAGPVVLRHLAGPHPTRSCVAAPPAAPRARPHVGPAPSSSSARRDPAAPCSAGRSASTRLELVPDARWLGRACADLEVRAAEPTTHVPRGLRSELSAALLRVGGGGGGRRVLAAGNGAPRRRARTRRALRARPLHPRGP